MSAKSLIRHARRSRRISQKTLSELSGIAPSSLSLIESGTRIPTVETLERLLASTGCSLVSIPTRRSDAATLTDQIADAIEAGRPQDAARLFIQINDNLVAEHNEVRFALTITAPNRTGQKHWDAAIAALVEYRLTEEKLPLPGWVNDPERSLKRSWTFNAGRYVVPVDKADVPQPFLDRGVHIDRETLVSV